MKFVKGYHPSPETEFKKGQVSPRKGVKLSEDTKLKISISRKGKCYLGMFKKGVVHNMAEKHWNWKGGTSRVYKTGYYSVEYKSWRKSVFERDCFTCQFCKVSGKNSYLTAHHIKSFARYPSLRFELDNGITLCEDCHKMTDNYKGKNNKKEETWRYAQ